MTALACSAPDAVDLRPAFRTAASSVWVVTTADDGVPAGFTAISVVSVSLDPALITFNVSRTSSTLPRLLRSRRFAVHLLGEDGEDVARRFAGPAAQRLRPDDPTWHWDDEGLPALDGVVARLTGHVAQVVEAGDSLVVVGEVTGSDVADDRQPLLHRARDYRRLAPG